MSTTHNGADKHPRMAATVFAFAAVLFFFSGLTGLMYETLWFHYCARVFGNSTYAAGTVVAIFMAGLALGARLFGPIADKSLNSLRQYAILECGVLAGALLIPVLLAAARPLTSMPASAPTFNWGTALMRFAVLSCVLLPPTVCMGGTLPVLARHAALNRANAASGFGFLYGANTLGAVAGCIAAGYWLLPSFGEQGCLTVTVGMNIVIALAAFLCARQSAMPGAACVQAGDAVAANIPRTRTMWIVGGCLALIGTASMACEIAWTRVMALMLGSSAYAFTALLAVFLAALGAGALVAARLTRGSAARLSWLVAIEAGSAAALAGTLPWYDLMARSAATLNASVRGNFHLSVALMFGVCAVMVVVPGILAGMVVPVAAAAMRSTRGFGTHTGTVYSLGTAGNIAGALVASFLLLPWLGIQGTLIVAMAVHACVAAVLAWQSSMPMRRTAVTWTLCAGLLVFGMCMPRWDPLTMTAGMYLYGTYINKDYRLLYHKDGIACTVSVSEYRGERHLRLNGKTDASNRGDMSTQVLAAHLPMFLKPDAQRVFVLGLGSGVTLGCVCQHNVRQVDCAEIEPCVVEASRYFEAVNHRPLSDPRVTMFIDDGRNVLRHARAPYDVIIYEPTNPWIKGVADLFTRESFEDCLAALSDTGVMCQWVQSYRLTLADYKQIMRTFASVFPYHAVYYNDIAAADTLLIGSRMPLTPDFDGIGRLIRQTPAIESDLCRYCGYNDPYALFIRLFAIDNSEYDIMCADAPRILSERHNTLEYNAARSLLSNVNNIGLIAGTLYGYKAQALPNSARVDCMRNEAVLDAFVVSGDRLIRAANINGAYSLFLQLARKAPMDVDALSGLVRAAALGAKNDVASNALFAVSALDVSRAHTLVTWLIAEKKTFLARGVAAQLHAADPRSPEAAANIAAVLADQGDSATARMLLHNALRDNPTNDAVILRGKALFPDEVWP